MIGSRDDSPYVGLCSLYTIAYYFPSRLVRQCGYQKRIPAEDTIAPKIYGLTYSGTGKWEKYREDCPIWYTEERLEFKKVSKSYIVWMLTRDPVMRMEMREKESSEVANKWKFLPRTAAKTLGGGNDTRKKPLLKLLL